MKNKTNTCDCSSDTSNDKKGALDIKTRTLVVLGAAVASNKPEEVRKQVINAKQLGLSMEELKEALEIGEQLKSGNMQTPCCGNSAGGSNKRTCCV
jgi:hypothetical protein